jgi:hypothetical protein
MQCEPDEEPDGTTEGLKRVNFLYMGLFCRIEKSRSHVLTYFQR